MAPTMYPPPDGPKNKKMNISHQGRERSRPAARLRPTVQKIIIVRVLGTHPPSGAEPKNKKKLVANPYKILMNLNHVRTWPHTSSGKTKKNIAR